MNLAVLVILIGAAASLTVLPPLFRVKSVVLKLTLGGLGCC